MSGHGYEELNILNRKIDDLLNRYNSLLNQVSELKAGQEDLKIKLHDREEKIKEFEKKYERVKLTGALLGESENAREAKRKITEMVREIDRCIALLNR